MARSYAQAVRTADRAGQIAPWRRELQAVYTLWSRDMLHFLRERSRLIGATGQPLLFWLLIGTGIGSTFQPRAFPTGFDYLSFFYPGIIGLTLLFTSIFSTISVIADREHGFLKEILVSPISRSSIVWGKVLAGSTIAVGQGALLLILAPFAGLALSLLKVIELIATMAVVALGLTALGLVFSWRMNSVQGFHMIMNFLLFPMWLLSGALFPLQGVPPVMRLMMYVNPLTYGVDAMRGLLVSPGTLPEGTVHFSFAVAFAASAGFSALLVLWALRTCRTVR